MEDSETVPSTPGQKILGEALVQYFHGMGLQAGMDEKGYVYRDKIEFTPDAENGRGTVHFDLEGFGADFAYTVDGGSIGELEYENLSVPEQRWNLKVFSHWK